MWMYSSPGHLERDDCNFFDFCADDILRTSDELSRVLERFQALSRTVRTPEAVVESRGAGLDLLDLGPPSMPTAQAATSSQNVLDEQLLSLGLDDPMPVSPTPFSLLQPMKPSQTFNGKLTFQNETST